MKTKLIFLANYLIFICVLSTADIYSQVLNLENLLPVSGSGDDFIIDQSSDNGNNVFIGGTYCSSVLTFDSQELESSNNVPSAFYQSDIFVAKYSANGSVQWVISGGGNYADKLTSIVSDAEGNTYFTGYFGSEVFEMDTFSLSKKSLSGVDMFIGKLDPDGIPLWVRNFGSKYDTWPRDLCLGAGDEIYVIGEFNGDSMDLDTSRIFLSGSFGFADVFVARMDASGNVLNVKTIEGDGEDLASAIAFRNGKIVIGVNHYSSTITFGSSQLNNRGMYDGFIGIMDRYLVPEAAREFTGNRQDFVYAVDINEQGNIVVAGSFKSDTLHVGDEQFINPTSTDDIKQYDIFLAVYDDELNLARAYSFGDLPNDDATAVKFDTQGNIILGGTMVGPSLQVGTHEIGHSSGTAGYTDLFIVKIGPDGNGVWSSVIHSGLDDENLSFNLLSDNFFVITGNYRGSVLDGGDLSIENYGAEGVYEPFLAIGRVGEATSVKQGGESSMEIYPNPAKSFLYFRNLAPVPTEISILDLSGRLIRKTQLRDNVLDIENLEPGIYMLKAMNGEGEFKARFVRSR